MVIYLVHTLSDKGLKSISDMDDRLKILYSDNFSIVSEGSSTHYTSKVVMQEKLNAVGYTLISY